MQPTIRTACEMSTVTLYITHRDGSGEYSQVADDSWSPATDRVSPRCAADRAVQAVSRAAGVRQTNSAMDTEAALHRVQRHLQLPG